MSGAKTAYQRRYALAFHRAYQLRYRTANWIRRHRSATTILLLLILFAGCLGAAPVLRGKLQPYFATGDRLAALRTMIATLGGALIGATAIAFSIVIFAVQINFARMPHGLFRKLSADWKLLSAFAATFLSAIAVTALSLLPDESLVSASILGGGLGTIVILVLFLYAYRRALLLINPLQQLRLIIEGARKEMRAWVRRARRAAPLLRSEEGESDASGALRSSHDMERAVYFQANPHWTAVSQQGIRHAISFARRYAEEGDHEVSREALNAVVAINALYVESKGKTFFANHLIFENPLATDRFINDTLEHLRQHVRIGISRADEQQIEQTFAAFAALARIYATIDYANKYAQEKQHAQLAAGYLSNAVQDVLPHRMADVLMEGVRMMGQSAQLFLAVGQPNQITTLAEKIAAIACAGAVKEDLRPVTMTAVEQLAQLTFDLLRTKAHDIRYAVGQLRRDVALVAKVFLALPDTPLSSIHSTALAPYYSMTKQQTLPDRLTALTNALLAAEADDQDASAVIRNLERWADGLFQSEKELLLAAIERRSHFTFDLIHWIGHVTKLLIAVSYAEACKDHTREELQKHARWLISVLSWIPYDKDTVAFAENFQVTETLFEAAMNALLQDCEPVFEAARDMLLSWAFRAGRDETGWAILERSVYALAILALRNEGTDMVLWLKAVTAERLAKDAPGQEARDHAAREIRRCARTLYRQDHATSRIEYAMRRADPAELQPLLEEIANLLSPATAGEPVGTWHY